MRNFINLSVTSDMTRQEVFKMCWMNARYINWNRGGQLDTGKEAYLGLDGFQKLFSHLRMFHPELDPSRTWETVYDGNKSITLKRIGGGEWLVTNAH